MKKDQLGTDPTVCIVDKTPSKTLSQQTPFTVGCGNETSGKYYIEASKVNDDGWNILSSGTIKISN